jgi:SAM-dependent methyltransferase
MHFERQGNHIGLEKLPSLMDLSSNAGDSDYQATAEAYAHYRQPDPEIAGFITRALGSSQTVVNVGAGIGSYEPDGLNVTAIEPSADMRQRRPAGRPAFDAVAGHLPFANDSFDAAMSTFSIHQWPDVRAGLAEMRRVALGPVLVLTCDPAALDCFWLNDYCPEVIAVEARRYPSLDVIGTELGSTVDVKTVPIPLRCIDGFQEAYYGRPERFLDANARRACFMEALSDDLASGAWDAKYGNLRVQPAFAGV